jgi:hypothetical protein
MSTTEKPARLRQQSGGVEQDAAGTLCPTPEYIPLLARGQICGCLYKDGVIRKTVRGSVHRLRTRVGWAIDLQALLRARDLGAHTLEIHDREDVAVYRASVAVVLKFGSTFDFGWGHQIGLDLDRWQVVRAGELVQGELFSTGVLA